MKAHDYTLFLHLVYSGGLSQDTVKKTASIGLAENLLNSTLTRNSDTLASTNPYE